MIVARKRHWLRLLFVWRGSVLPIILPRLTFLWLLACVVTLAHGALFTLKISLNPAPFTLIGISLAIFLGFRNSAAYDRFWEARKLWGALTNDCRSLVRQLLSLAGVDPRSEEARHFAAVTSALVHALKHQLRGSDAADDLRRLLPSPLAEEAVRKRYKPVFLMQVLADLVRARTGLPPILVASFDASLSRLSDVIGGCERIRGTPIPFPYSVLLHRTVYVSIVSQIEDPFGVEENDLALNTMSANIEASLREMLGEQLPKGAAVPDATVLD